MNPPTVEDTLHTLETNFGLVFIHIGPQQFYYRADDGSIYLYYVPKNPRGVFAITQGFGSPEFSDDPEVFKKWIKIHTKLKNFK